jgi:hypothetical protein
VYDCGEATCSHRAEYIAAPFPLRYAHYFQTQTTETALANGRSKIEERLARWILMAADRIDGDELPLVLTPAPTRPEAIVSRAEVALHAERGLDGGGDLRRNVLQRSMLSRLAATRNDAREIQSWDRAKPPEVSGRSCAAHPTILEAPASGSCESQGIGQKQSNVTGQRAKQHPAPEAQRYPGAPCQLSVAATTKRNFPFAQLEGA